MNDAVDPMQFDQIAICRNPIFIIGSPRSGTTTLILALARHSELWASGESHILMALYGRDKIRSVYDKAVKRPEWAWLRREAVSKSDFSSYLGAGINALFTSRSKGKRWIEKTPSNTQMVDSLAEMFPGAYFLHLVRDGRSVVNSMTHFKDHNSPMTEVPWADSFQRACETWSRFTEIGIEFEESRPDRCIRVVNERMSTDPEAEFRALYDFIGVSWEERPVRFFQSTRLNSSFGNRDSGVSPPTPETAWNQWTPEQRGIFAEVAGPTMTRLGYATQEDLAPGSDGEGTGE